MKNKETEEVVGKLTTDKDGVATSELLLIATYEDGKSSRMELITYMYYRKRNRWKDMKSIRKSYEITFSYVDAKQRLLKW